MKSSKAENETVIRIPFLVFILLSIFIISSCSHDEPEPAPATTGKVQFQFINEVDGQLIQTDTLLYLNEAGNLYSVGKMLYYISNLTFIRADGTEYFVPENYELIDQKNDATKFFEVDSIPFGNYSAIRFNVGVDSTKNFAGALTGDLDPALEMYWDWSSGYVYFKHEGYFIDSTGVQQEVHFHYGTLKGLVTEQIPVTLEVTAQKKFVDITFNLNEIYSSPNIMEFNGGNYHQSNGPGDIGWVQAIKENFQGAFEVTEVQ